MLLTMTLEVNSTFTLGLTSSSPLMLVRNLPAPREVEEGYEFFAMPPTEKQLLAPFPLNLS